MPNQIVPQQRRNLVLKTQKMWLTLYVLTDALKELGMPNFSGKLTEDEVTKIQAFIQGTADAVKAQMGASK